MTLYLTLYQCGDGVGIVCRIAAILIGRMLAPRVRRLIDFGFSKLPEQLAERAQQYAPLVLDHGLRPALWIGCLWIGQTVLAGMGQPFILVRIAVVGQIVTDDSGCRRGLASNRLP